MLKNNKGFTLAELLATVTILGILSVIAIGSVSGILERGRTEHYKTAEKQMIEAAKSYAQINRAILPKTLNGESIVTLDTLKTNKFISELKDHTDKIPCTKGEVTIKKVSQTRYTYTAYLECGKYKTS